MQPLAYNEMLPNGDRLTQELAKIMSVIVRRVLLCVIAGS